MGLFGSRTKIYVSSSIYNMAGGYEERTDYLKFLVLHGVLSGSEKTVGEVISSGTLNGPRMNYQSFFKWAKTNYPEGMPKGGIFGSVSIDHDTIKPHIPVPSGSEAVIELIETGPSDYYQWAFAWMNENHPSLITSDWGADIVHVTGNVYMINIYFENNTTTSFIPSNFRPDGTYIYVRYHTKKASSHEEPVYVSDVSESGPLEDEPEIDGYDLVDEAEFLGEEFIRYEITRVTKTYSDATPTDISETKSSVGNIPYDKFVQTFDKYLSMREEPGDKFFWDISRKFIWQEPAYDEVVLSTDSDTVEISPGVFETTVTEEIEQVMRITGNQWYVKEELWEQDVGEVSNAMMFTYRKGSGKPTLDVLFDSEDILDGYFPMIPVRTNNRMVDEAPHLENIYDIAAKAWKRASSGKKFTNLLDEVKDNENLSDIDYAFVIWGVPLNTLSDDGKLYIYHFFKTMMSQQKFSQADFLEYQSKLEAWNASLENEDVTEDPPLLEQPPETTIRINCEHSETKHYDFRLSWTMITESSHVGKFEPDNKKNDVSVTKGETISLPNGYKNKTNVVNFNQSKDTLVIKWQETNNSYRIMTITGLVHRNVVYGEKSVDITSSEAMDDEEDSGFIVPLHYSILRELPITKANQLCLEAMQIVFNCYKVVKKKWYQTFLGQILLGLFSMGIGAIFSGGASIMAGSGILGSNVAVGSMFGFTGMAGALAGAAINSIVMTTIMVLVQEVAGELGALGAIFSALAGIVIGGMTAGAMGSPTGFSFDVFLRSDNLLKLTNSVLDAYSIHMQEKTQDIYGEIRDLETAYKKQKREIDKLMYELTGFSSGIDPMIMTDILRNGNENRDAFNQRTLMTGSDIAMMTHNLVNSFATISLDLEALKG